MKEATILQEVNSFLTKVYGIGWENNPRCPNTDEVSSITYQNADMLARGVGKKENLFKEIGLAQLVGAFLDEFRVKGPDFLLTTSNPRLAALIITPPTFRDALQWHRDHPGYKGGEKLRELEPILKEHWGELRPQLLS